MIKFTYQNIDESSIRRLLPVLHIYEAVIRLKGGCYDLIYYPFNKRVVTKAFERGEGKMNKLLSLAMTARSEIPCSTDVATKMWLAEKSF